MNAITIILGCAILYWITTPPDESWAEEMDKEQRDDSDDILFL